MRGLRGRQYMLCISLSTVVGALSGSAVGVAAMLGRSLYPSMVQRGYDSNLSLGTILAGASLAPIIPPSVLVIIIGTLADVSIARLLIAGIIPGLLLSGLFLVYTFLRPWYEGASAIRELSDAMNPALAPKETETPVPATTRDYMLALVRMLPFALIIFSVMGFILLGIATPSEAAATGVTGSILTAAIYRRLSLQMLWDALVSSAAISAMVLSIMASSNMFSQLLAFTGATAQLTHAVVGLGLGPAMMLLMMMGMTFILCMFIEQIALLLVIIPIYKPLLVSLGFDPVWFWTLMLLNVTSGGGRDPPHERGLHRCLAVRRDIRPGDAHHRHISRPRHLAAEPSVARNSVHVEPTFSRDHDREWRSPHRRSPG